MSAWRTSSGAAARGVGVGALPLAGVVGGGIAVASLAVSCAVHSTSVGAAGLAAACHVACAAVIGAARRRALVAGSGADVKASYGRERVWVVTAFTLSGLILFSAVGYALSSLPGLLLGEGHTRLHEHTAGVMLLGVAAVAAALLGMLLSGGSLSTCRRSVNQATSFAPPAPGIWSGSALPLQASASLPPTAGTPVAALLVPPALAMYTSPAACGGMLHAHYALAAIPAAGILLAALAARLLGGLAGDALVALGVCGWATLQAWPLFLATGAMLLQAAPEHARAYLDRARRDVCALDGVLEVTAEHAWTFAPGMLVLTLCVRVRRTADEAALRTAIARIYAPLVRDLTVQVEKDAIQAWDATPSSATPMAYAAGAASSPVVVSMPPINAHQSAPAPTLLQQQLR